MSEQQFPDIHADEIVRLMQADGSPGVIYFVRNFEEPAQRIQLFALAQQKLGNDMPDCDLDDFIDVVEAGIDEALVQAQEAPDDEQRRKLTDRANVLAYNLSSALADCWPADDRHREEWHLQTGLEAAEMCLQWREELGKGPFPFSIAWWAKGIHLLALGQVQAAEDAFTRALRHAEAHVTAQGGSIAHDATGDWLTLLSEGYVQIARTRRTGSRAGFDALMTALAQAIAARPQEAEDLQFTADQLSCAFERHAVR